MTVKLFLNRKLSAIGNRNILNVSFFIFLMLCQSVYSQNFGSGYYRLTTKWLGETKSLDVVNDGTNNKLQLADSGDYSGQSWKITSVGNGYYRLTTQWLGESKSLDIVNSGAKNQLQLAKSGDYSGQLWKITPVKGGYYRLTSQWLGDAKSLDIVNSGAKNQIQLADSGNYDGQFWKISAVSADANINDSEDDDAPLTTKQIYLHGFKIIINSKIAEREETKTALDLLSENLRELPKIVKPRQLKLLKQVPIWVEIKHKADGAMWYHKSKEWVAQNGYPAEALKSVEICNVVNFVRWQEINQPYMVLHELAHAYHDIHLTAMHEKIRSAYNSAKLSGKYDNVQRKKGVKERAYAMNNEDEYFAELTEAYLGINDYYPFDRLELKEFDPAGYKIMQEAWD